MKNQNFYSSCIPGILLALLAISLIHNAEAQDFEAFLRPYADDIIEDSKFEFTDMKTGQKFTSTKHLSEVKPLKVEADYLHWHYTSALVFDGLLSLGKVLGDENYTNFGNQYFRFIFGNQDYILKAKVEGVGVEGLERFGRFRGIWEDGAQAAALLRIYPADPRPEYLSFLEKVGEFFFQYYQDPERDARRKNIDALYTYGVYMARMGQLTGEKKYFDYCVEKVFEMDRLFYDPQTGLYDQMYYPELKTTNKLKWLRGIGWSAIAMANILEALPVDHPGYEEVLAIYRKQVSGIAAYQTGSGLWKHLVDHPESYNETSGSVFIIYAMAKGINDGILDPMYRDVAMAGWKGVLEQRQPNGDITGSTTGISSSTSPAYFLTFPQVSNSDHLLGPLFLAGAEIIRLYESYDGPVPGNWDLSE